MFIQKQLCVWGRINPYTVYICNDRRDGPFHLGLSSWMPPLALSLSTLKTLLFLSLFPANLSHLLFSQYFRMHWSIFKTETIEPEKFVDIKKTLVASWYVSRYSVHPTPCTHLFLFVLNICCWMNFSKISFLFFFVYYMAFLGFFFFCVYESLCLGFMELHLLFVVVVVSSQGNDCCYTARNFM